MATYVVKGPAVQALRWDPRKKKEALPSWFFECCARGVVFLEFDGDLTVRTPEGYKRARPGDWVTYGAKGALGVKTPDEFRQAYD